MAAARGTTPTDWAGTRGFVGGTKDATGLTHIGAREYDPVLQRFTTVDPIMVLEDPLQWNPYTYAENSPITFSDPTGLVTDGGRGSRPPGEWSSSAGGGANWTPIYPSASAGYAKQKKRTTTKFPKKYSRPASSGGGGGGSNQDWSPPENRSPAPPAPKFEWPDPAKMLQGVNWTEVGHVALDLAGLIPGVGEIADGANAAWYAAEGDWANAALSAAGMIPGLGAGVIAAKYAKKAGGAATAAAAGVTKLADGADNIALGRRELVEEFARQVGARHLMGSSDLKADVLRAAYDSRSRFHINLDGVGDIQDAVARGKYREMKIKNAKVRVRDPSWFDWEMYVLREAGADGRAIFIETVSLCRTPSIPSARSYENTSGAVLRKSHLHSEVLL